MTDATQKGIKFLSLMPLKSTSVISDNCNDNANFFYWFLIALDLLYFEHVCGYDASAFSDKWE